MNAAATFLAQLTFSSVGELHRAWGWWATGLLALSGVWALMLALFRREPGTVYWIVFGLATVSVLGQVGMGIWALTVEGIEPGNQHVFYGVVIMFTLAFAYIYRAQLAKRPALSYGVLALFLMGLGMRAIANFGQNF